MAPRELEHSSIFIPLSSSYLQAKLSIGQREVTIQKGPLYRAEGYPVSISCNVSGHQGPSTQDFQWSVYLPTAPTREVQIISTKDASFSYAVYAQRVKSKEIYVERLQGSSVLLHIAKLQMRDAGEYECFTPNTDGKYFGSYSAKTNLTGELLLASSWQACLCHHNALPREKLSISLFALDEEPTYHSEYFGDVLQGGVSCFPSDLSHTD